MRSKPICRALAKTCTITSSPASSATSTRASRSTRGCGVCALMSRRTICRFPNRGLTSGSSQTSLFARVMPGVDHPDIQSTHAPSASTTTRTASGQYPPIPARWSRSPFEAAIARAHHASLRLSSRPAQNTRPLPVAGSDLLGLLKGLKRRAPGDGDSAHCQVMVSERSPGAGGQIRRRHPKAFIRVNAQSVYHRASAHARCGSTRWPSSTRRLRVHGVASPQGRRRFHHAVDHVGRSQRSEASCIGEKAADMILANNP